MAASLGYPNPFAPDPVKPASPHQPITRLSRDQRRVSRASS
jgi:hypothetical protein